MRLIDLKCSDCGASMKANPELKKVMCPYCGKEMLIDDEIKKVQIDNSFDFGYESEKGKLKAQKEHELELIREEEEKKQRAEQARIEEANRKAKEKNDALLKSLKTSGVIVAIGALISLFSGGSMWFGILLIFTGLGISWYKYYTLYCAETVPNRGAGEIVEKIKFPRGLEPFEERNYMEIKNALEDAGFENIECINMKDVVIGLFAKNGRVASVSVNGTRIISGGKSYTPDVPIIIEYHGK